MSVHAQDMTLGVATVGRIARRPRIEVAGGYYHVFARGNERRAIYRDDNDRTSFLELLEEVVEGFVWTLFSYCLMTNHYHLVVRTAAPNLSAGMHRLNALAAQRFNRRHGRAGHLFQGRFKARLLQDGDRLLGAIRYVVRNPVRAGLCERPDQWRWSSQAAVLGLVPPGHVAVNEVLRLFHPDRQTARKLYREFTDSNEGDERQPAHPLVDGDERFTADHLALVSANPGCPKRLLRPPPPPLEKILSPNPATPELAAVHAAGHTLAAIADHLHLHKSTISRRLARAASGGPGGAQVEAPNEA
jgi:putative transposase